jgi:hypothetical protein
MLYFHLIEEGEEKKKKKKGKEIPPWRVSLGQTCLGVCAAGHTCYVQLKGDLMVSL